MIPARARRVRGLPATMRGRLIAGLLVLLACACAAVGVASVLALGRSLHAGIDRQLAQAGGRFAASLEHSAAQPGKDRYAAGGDTRAQAAGTFGARVLNGTVTHAGVVSPRRDMDDVSAAGAVPTLSAEDRAKLAGLPADGRGRSVKLSWLGDYRLMAVPGADGDTLVTGLPLVEAEGIVHRLQAVEGVVFAVALVVTGVAGALWVGAALRPLRRVAATARDVTGLPLADGEVALPDGVSYTDPRTEVGQVGAAFNRMLEHVGDALARRHAVEQRLRTFAADAGHELRTPLAAIRGHAELARRHPGPVSPEVGRALDRIQAESVRMGRLVEDLLLLARLDAGRPLLRDEVDLTRLVLDATGDARVAGPDHRWRLDLPEEPVMVRGDADRLHQVLANLLDNARRHTPAGTTVLITVLVRAAAAADGTRVELSVTDDGPGFPEELAGEIFERFVRADQGRSRASGGTGLGLAIVRAVVAAHGGSAEAESRPGRTVFRILLPAPGPAPHP
ncbi:HAMP domain-containing sensor histidine kinase [Sphaerisporangium sp. NPDC051017]|uniref:sensor histidine kinase n=1 Tax=Sphaerisporangium sp. NPDC051017 TaxID=3154636 RepID=UPI0034203AA0